MIGFDLGEAFRNLRFQVADDMENMFRDARLWLVDLNASEKLVLLCVAILGLFFFMLRHFQRGETGDTNSGKFAGILLVVVAFSVAAGWTISGQL